MSGACTRIKKRFRVPHFSRYGGQDLLDENEDWKRSIVLHGQAQLNPT